MAGRLDRQPRDLVIEELVAQAVVEEAPDKPVEEENIALGLFLAIDTFAKKHLPHEKKSRSRNLSKQLEGSVEAIREIISSDHFLDAVVSRGDGQVRVEVQVEPGSTSSLEDLKEFRVCLPGSRVVDEVFVIGRKNSKVESRGRHHLDIHLSEIVLGRSLPTYPDRERPFTEDDLLTVTQLMADVNSPTTQITYRRVRKPAC